VGAFHVTPRPSHLPRGRRPRARICLRKGCGRKYVPRCWNQRYCQDPDCQRQVRRWQAARRQAKRRQDAQVKAQHAQAEKARRQRAKAAPKTAQDPAVVPARGHAAEPFFPLPYVIVRAATNPPCARPVIPHATAVPPAVRRSVTSKTGNASGFRAAPWMVVRSGPLSIEPRASGGSCGAATPPPIRRREHPQNEDSAQARRSSIIAWL
jgi:hypothetical protein